MIDSIKLLMSKDKEFVTLLKKQLKVSPNNLKLYELAFLHRSASLTLLDGSVVNNERLEFLGDAIIDAVIADYLFRKFPNEREGFLTRMRSKIVNRTHLDSIATRMGLVEIVVAYATNTETVKKRICGEALEALMGAMYLDKGFEKTHKYITEHVLKNYVDLNKLVQTETDFKSRLLEWGQKYRLPVDFETIEVTREKSKNQPYFSVRVTISDVPIAKGSGKSKKEAEQMASQKTLNFISSSSDDFSIDALVHYLERMKRK
ncbi:MAG: ribonuclease III [Bacteroidales bacterium]|nr:ribonuclease III [Bacteroidales bacterium]